MKEVKYLITIGVDSTQKVEHVIQYMKNDQQQNCVQVALFYESDPEYYQVTLYTSDSQKLIIPMNNIVHVKTPNGKSIIKGKSFDIFT